MFKNIGHEILAMIDLGVVKNLPDIKTSGIVSDFEILLSSQRHVKVSTFLTNGPLLLIFIRGTWCPFCRVHLQKLRQWVQHLKGKNATIVVVSTEPVEAIQEWLKENPISYLFASDPEYVLSDYFGVRIAPKDFAQAATFLIDSNFNLQLAYHGKRGSDNLSAIDSKI